MADTPKPKPKPPESTHEDVVRYQREQGKEQKPKQ